MYPKKISLFAVALLSFFQISHAQLNLSISGPTEACLGIYEYRLSECVPSQIASNINWSISKADGSSAAGLAQVSGTFVFCSTPNAGQVNFLASGSYRLTCLITLVSNGAIIPLDLVVTVANLNKPLITNIIGKGACVGDVTTYHAFDFHTGTSPSEYTYNWEFTNPQTGTITSNGANATVTYLQTGSGELSVTPSIPGCIGDKVWSGTVNYVHPYPTPVISSLNGQQDGSNITRCGGGAIILSSSVETANQTFQWKINGQNVNGNQQNLEVYEPSTASVVVTNSLTCSTESAPVNVSWILRPEMYPIPIQTVCSDGTLNYTPTLLDPLPGTTFMWDGPNGRKSGSSIIETFGSNVSSSPILYNFTVYSFYNGCNGNILPMTVYLKPSPVLTSTLTPTSVCSGSTFNYAPSLNNGSSVSWTRASILGILEGASVGSNGISEILTNTTTAPIDVTYVFSLISTGNVCSNTQNVVVTVNPIPTLTSSLTPQSICAGSAFIYLPTTNISGSGISWKRAAVSGIDNPAMLFGSGDINETLRISGVAAANASYIITPGFRGCPGIPQQLIVTVNPLPFASMSISPGFTTFCSGNSVTLTSTTGSSYMWSTGATTQSITVSTAGNYTVTVSNANGCSATSAPTTITVNALPSVTITPSGATTLCLGGSVTLTASAGSSYIWSTGATTQSITVSTAGNYTVTVTNANGCSATSAPTTITANPLPSVTITPSGATTFCQGGSVTLTASAGSSYLWSTGATTQSITVSTAGNYTGRVTNANGCMSAASAATVVTVNALPSAPSITASGSTTFCPGGTVSLTSSAGSSYLWSTGATTQSITVSAAGNYTVRVTNANGCMSAASAATAVTPTPGPVDGTISANTTSICLGQSVTISGTGGTGTRYYWASTNGGSTWNVFSQQYGGQSSFTYTPTAAGTYRFHLRNQNSCGFCFNLGTCTTNPYVDVVVNPVPSVYIAGDGATFCSGSSTSLTAVSSAPYFAWSTGVAGSYASTINVFSGGTYSVTVHLNGCQSSAQATVYDQYCDPNPDPCYHYGICPCFDQFCPRKETPSGSEPSDDPNVSELSVFPNPATGQVTVALPERVDVDTPVRFFDLLGRQQGNMNIPKGQWKISVSLDQAAEGTYIIKVGRIGKSVKLIVKR